MADTSSSSEAATGLEMSLPARAENVAVVRHALAGLAEEIGMDEAGIADLKTVVTEACMNVVVHAYEGEPGPLEVEAEPRARRPHGDRAGLRRRHPARDPRRTVQPAPRPFADRRALQQLLVLGRARPRHRGRDAPPPDGRRRDGRRASGAGRDLQRRDRDRDRQVGADRARCWLASSGRSPPAATSRSTGSPTPSCSPTRSPPPPRAASPTAGSSWRSPTAKGASSCASGRWKTAPRRRSAQELDVPDIGGSLEALADEIAVEGSGDGDYLAIRFSSPAPAP